MKKVFKISDVIVEFFSKKKSNHYFLVPGGGNMHLVDSVKKSKDVKYTSFFHEQSACIAAESFSRINGNLGICLVTSGPGSTNVLTSVVGAWIESIPLIIISGQVKTKDLTKKFKVRQTGPQEVDIVSMVKKITKYSKTIKKSENILYELEKAYQCAISKRQGPVWLDIPLDIQAEEIEISKIGKKLKKLSINRSIKKIKLKEINSKLNKAKRPLMYIGHGVRLADSKKIFHKVLSKFKIPFVTTWNSLDIVPISNPLNFGSPGVVARRFSNIIVQNCDLLICVGARINEVNTAFNTKSFAPLSKKIIVDIDNNELKKLKLKNTLKINLDAKIFFEYFMKLNYNSKKINFWKKNCSILKKKYLNEKFSKKSKKLDHYTFTKVISKIIPENYIISTGSSGLAIEIFYTHFENKKNQRIFLTSGLGSMGYGLPSSIGSCVANKYKKNICLFESDGSFMFNLQELATISSYKLPIKIFLMNNQGYASIRNTQKSFFKENYVGTGTEDNINYPNFKQLSESFNIKYFKIKNIHDLKKIKNYLYYSKPILFDIILKKNEDLVPKVKTFFSKQNKIKSMPLEDLYPYLSLDELKRHLNFPTRNTSRLVRNKINK